MKIWMVMVFLISFLETRQTTEILENFGFQVRKLQTWCIGQFLSCGQAKMIFGKSILVVEDLTNDGLLSCSLYSGGDGVLV